MRRSRRQRSLGRGSWLVSATALLVALVITAGPAAALPGDLDPAFGVGGRLTTDLGGTYDWAYATAVQPDGRVLAAGMSNASGTYDFALVRYTATGILDPTFGQDGTVTVDFGSSDDRAFALALQPDGRIVVAGVSDGSGSRDFALVRHNPDGSLDRTFGTDGLVAVPVRPLTTDIIRGLAVLPDGGLLAAGVTYDDTVSLRAHGDFMLARYTPAGGLDPGFGVGGVVTTNFGPESYDEPYAVSVQPDGSIVLGGVSNTGGGVGTLFGADNLALARYLPTGLLDPDFGEGGRVVVDAGGMQEQIRALALDARGGIVAAGLANGERGGDLLLVRFERNGALDAGFGATRPGMTITDRGTAREGLHAVVLDAAGRILGGGHIEPRASTDLAVVRYDPTGHVDPSFAHHGFATVDFGGRDDRVRGLAFQSGGKAVAVGYSESDFVVARLAAGG